MVTVTTDQCGRENNSGNNKMVYCWKTDIIIPGLGTSHLIMVLFIYHSDLAVEKEKIMNNNCLSSAFKNCLYDNDNCSMNNREMLFLLLLENKWTRYWYIKMIFLWKILMTYYSFLWTEQDRLSLFLPSLLAQQFCLIFGKFLNTSILTLCLGFFHVSSCSRVF